MNVANAMAVLWGTPLCRRIYKQLLERVFYNNANIDSIDDIDEDMAEALFMIAHKIGRIVNGDPWYADSWIDIAGYAKLVADRLENNIER